MSVVSFDRTGIDPHLLAACARRARAMEVEGVPITKRPNRTERIMHHSMNLVACHANGTPLDFERLARFDAFNFAHDVFGIDRHIDRDTGKLSNCFLPRCRKKRPNA